MAAAAGAAEAAVRRRRRGQDKNPQNPRKLFTSPRVRTAGIRQPGVRSGPKALLFVIHDSGTRRLKDFGGRRQRPPRLRPRLWSGVWPWSMGSRSRGG